MTISPVSSFVSIQPHRQALKSALKIALVTAILLIGFVLLVFTKFSIEPLVFVNMGERFDQGITNGRAGSDGQFPYYMAAYGTQSVSKMDLPPAHRYQRILYPVLAAILALGQRALIPWSMLLINLIALVIGSGLTAYWLARYTRGSPWLALLSVLWGGSLISLRFDMLEPLAMVLGLAALVFYSEDRIVLALIAAALTGLAKDAGLVLIAALVIHAFLTKRRRVAFGLAGAAVIPYVAWAVIIHFWLRDMSSVLQPERQLSIIPFGGLAGSFSPVFLTLGLLWTILPTLILGYVVGSRLIRQESSRTHVESWLLITSCLLIVVVPAGTFSDLPSMLRYSQPLILAAILYVAYAVPRRTSWLIGLWAPTCILGLLIALSTF
jgi:hypothetical protein